jgi:Domain of unknown function (DUF4350)
MRRLYSAALLLACAAILIGGIVWLFELRFEAGDVYPPYSSLRSDPLGTMAFYESLAGLPDFAASRDISTVNGLPDGSGTTYFDIALSVPQFRGLSEATLKEMERFATEGGRLVVTVFPDPSKSMPEDVREKAQSPGLRQPEPVLPTPYRDHWGLAVEAIGLDRREDSYSPAEVFNQSGLPLPPSLDWHSGVVLSPSIDGWKTVYVRQSNPVMVEREFGKGSVVVATDSYFLSNEAMQMERHTDLLAWLVGENRNVVFDERHLGVTETPGVAALMRRYRLHGFVASLIGLAALFVWKNSTSLAPPYRELSGDYVAGKDASAGFINLLRRGIPVPDLLGTCFNEWKASAAGSPRCSSTRIENAERRFAEESARPSKHRDPVKAYRDISQILKLQDK